MSSQTRRFAFTPTLALHVLLWFCAPAAWCQEQPRQSSMTVEEAIQALNSPRAIEQEKAAIALVKAGAKAKPAVPVIIDILNREWPDVRTDVLFILLELGPDAQDAVPVLIQVAGSANFHARYLTARVLGAMGPPSKPAVPVLIKMVSDEVTSVRRRAVEALGNLGPEVAPEAIQPLLLTMKDPRDAVREQAVLAVGKYGEAGKAALPALRPCPMRPACDRKPRCLSGG
jgi:HEAT repeat protein